MSYLDKTIHEIHLSLVKKETTPLELAREAIARARASKDNAFELIDEEEALSFAASLTEPEEDNPLWGIPFVAKDNFSTKGLETTASSDILKGYIPIFDATVITKLKGKKAVLIGKSTMDELAMGGTGTSGHLGKTFNPYDANHQRMVGGSSAGSAAIVASDIVPFSLGSDTGDSVRKPASYAGLVGFKPTWGRISRFGLFPFAPSLDTVGFFTRDVEDAAIVLSALSGHDEKDVTSSLKEVDDYLAELDAGIAGKRIVVFDDIVASLTDDDLIGKFEKSLTELERKGAIVSHMEFGKELLESIYATYFVISCAEATSNNANLDGIKFGPFFDGKTYQEVMMKARTAGFSKLIKRRFVIGSYCLMNENREELFERATKNRGKIVRRLNEILAEHDFVYAPAAPGVAPKFDQLTDRLSAEYLIADNHLALGNFAGLPSITLPLTLEGGLPIGVNLMGRAFEEKELLMAAKTLEGITGLSSLSSYREKEGNL